MKVLSIDYMTNPEPGPETEPGRHCDFCYCEIQDEIESAADWRAHPECVPAELRWHDPIEEGV